jgi:hypothetical protein
MSVNSLNTFLNVKDSHLRVVSGNVYATAMNIGGINIDVAHGLQSVTNQGNVTSNTLQFANATTAFVTTANVTVGRDLTVTGNTTVSSNLTVTGNAVISDDLTVTENLLVSNNLTVTGNTFYTNPAAVLVDSNVVAEYTGPHDRPLRKYPEIILPRAAVGADYNGYRIDRSSEHVTGVYDGVQDLFNETAVDYTDTWGAGWQGTSGAYSTSTGEHSTYVTGGTTQGTGARLASNVPNGEWVSLKSPNAIKLDNIKIRSRNAGDWYGQFPTDFQIWGSNDGTTWSHVKTFTGQAAAGQSILHTFPVNSTTFYNRHALVVTKIPGTASTIVVSTGHAHFSISELRFNAHEEGSASLDTTLKTVYNVPATTGTQLEVYYDAKDLATMPSTVTDLSPNSNGGSVSGDPQVSNGAFVFDGVGDFIESGTLSLTGDAVHSISVWFNANQVNSYRTIVDVTNTTTNLGQLTHAAIRILDGKLNNHFYGDDITSSVDILANVWYHAVTTYQGGGSTTTTRKTYLNGVEITEFSFDGTTGGNLSLTSPTLCLGRDQVRNINEFDGRIANVRLYSKALNADQVKELYDYQKDYFLGSKSQVTLYKGHLGVGVTEPSGQLELAGDERLQEYPPRALTKNETAPDAQTVGKSKNITYIEGHGEFKASALSGSVGDDWL